MDDNVANQMVHVYAMDTHIIHHRGLRMAIALGFNHLPLRNTNI